MQVKKFSFLKLLFNILNIRLKQLKALTINNLKSINYIIIRFYALPILAFFADYYHILFGKKCNITSISQNFVIFFYTFFMAMKLFIFGAVW